MKNSRLRIFYIRSGWSVKGSTGTRLATRVYETQKMWSVKYEKTGVVPWQVATGGNHTLLQAIFPLREREIRKGGDTASSFK